jgi:hypothetical protein
LARKKTGFIAPHTGCLGKELKTVFIMEIIDIRRRDSQENSPHSHFCQIVSENVAGAKQASPAVFPSTSNGAPVDSRSNSRELVVLDMKKDEFMKTNHLQKMLAVIVVASLAFSAATLSAQTAADNTAPYLSYGASQILRLTQAKIGDDTITAYIKNSPNGYALNADQIIYLRQQGVSDAVIGVMLNQPKTSVTAATSASTVTTSASGSTITTPNGSTATVAPTVTYVQTAPAPSVYVVPDTQTYYYDSGYYQPYYYPYYGWSYPAVSLSFGFGGGYHGGGFHDGGFRGGGFHGGFRR